MQGRRERLNSIKIVPNYIGKRWTVIVSLNIDCSNERFSKSFNSMEDVIRYINTFDAIKKHNNY